MIRINLLPKEERVQKKAMALPRVSAVVPYVVLAMFLGGIVAVTAFERSNIAGLKKDIATAEEEARRLKPQIDKVNELTRKREELNTRLQVIQDLDKGRFHSVRLMDEVAQELPPYMWMTELRDPNGTKVTLDGVTFSNLVVADLMMRFEKSPVFKNVDLVVTEKGSIDSRRVTKFTITAEVEPGSTSAPRPDGSVAFSISDLEDDNGF